MYGQDGCDHNFLLSQFLYNLWDNKLYFIYVIKKAFHGIIISIM